MPMEQLTLMDYRKLGETSINSRIIRIKVDSTNDGSGNP